MAENFRPTRRPVNPLDEVAASENQQNLQKIAAIRQQAENVESDNQISQNTEIPSNPNITGTIPPQFKQAVQQKMNPQSQQPQQQQQHMQRSRSTPQSNELYEKNHQLEDLIAKLTAKTQIHEEVKLPSCGKFYDGTNGPSDGILHLRPMTGEEEQILATPRFVKKGMAIDMILNKCMQEKYDSSNFLHEDRVYMMIYIRGISYSPDYDVQVKCPHCDKKFAHTINLDDLYVDSCPDDYGIEKLTDVLPESKFSFKYRLATGKDEKSIQEYRDRRMKGFEVSQIADDTLLYQAAMLIEEIEGLTDKHEIQKLLQFLQVNDLTYLRNAINEVPFGVDSNVEIPCPACLQDFEVKMPYEADFFFPRGKKKVSTPA